MHLPSGAASFSHRSHSYIGRQRSNSQYTDRMQFNRRRYGVIPRSRKTYGDASESLCVALGIVTLPVPAVAAHIRDAVLRMPSEQTLCL